MSLQWGREQTHTPNTQPHSTTGLALANHKLAEALHAHLLGNVGTSNQKKIPAAGEFVSTPAEKMAEKVTCFLFLSCGMCSKLGGFIDLFLKAPCCAGLALGAVKCGASLCFLC